MPVPGRDTSLVAVSFGGQEEFMIDLKPGLVSPDGRKKRI